MNIAIFNSKSYDRDFLQKANQKAQHNLTFFEPHLNQTTAKLASGYEGVCVFVNDELDQEVLKILSQEGIKLVALRCAGFNNIDLNAAQDLGITIVRVPAYSPHGVAEHAVAMMLALNRKIYRSHNRIREGNFSLEGLLGFEMHGKTVGIIGGGKIGKLVAGILKGFGMNVLVYDTEVSEACKSLDVEYVNLNTLYAKSDIITLHVPLTKETYHMINDDSVSSMKDGVMVINTSRGGLIDTQSVIKGLKSEKIAYLGLDVYEEEGDLFFEDLSNYVMQDDTFARLLTFPNVIVTGHQAFFTQTALKNIAETTLENISDFENGKLKDANIVSMNMIKK